MSIKKSYLPSFIIFLPIVLLTILFIGFIICTKIWMISKVNVAPKIPDKKKTSIKLMSDMSNK